MNKNVFFVSFLFLACAATHSTSAPPPAPDLDTVKTIYDTIFRYVHDTTVKIDSIPIPYPVDVIHNDTVIVPVNTSDTGNIFGTIYVLPTYTGDDWPNLQGAATWQAWHPGCMIKVIADDYQLSRPLLFTNIQGTDYGQVKAWIEGPVSARNSPKSTVFHCNFPGGMGMGIQNGKGCKIKNINLIGQYTFANALTPLEIDTLLFSQWPDTLNGGSRTSVYSGICIDPFSDPKPYDGVSYKKYAGLESYYLPGMGQGGSTAIDIEDCQITQFVAGVMITPSMQANGELVNISGCRIDGVKVAVAYSQAQSKANTISRLMSWGNVHTVIDGADYGFPRGDGSTAPMVDVMNIAGYTHQILHITAASFPVVMNKVYAEGLFKIGMVEQGLAGVHFSDWQVDFQNGQAGVPSPDFYYFGTNTTWSSCMLRLYNGSGAYRIVLNSLHNIFRDGSMGSPPVVATLNPSQASPQLENVTMYWNNGILNCNNYDSLVYRATVPITVNRSNFTGYAVLPSSAVGMGPVFTTPTLFLDYPAQGSQVGALGFVTRISGDTAFLTNIGQNIHSGQPIDLYDCKIKLKTQLQ